MRLIDADPLEKEVGEMWETQDGTEDGFNESLKAIHRAPTIDPVRHGHWVRTNRISKFGGWLMTVCSVCGKECSADANRGYYDLSEYCHCCGAKMDR